MDRSARADHLRNRIEDLARADTSVPPITHVCGVCAQELGAAAVCVSMAGPQAVYEPVCADGPAGMALAELQATVGEGPGVEVVGQDRPILVKSVDTPAVQERWPLFAPAAIDLGVSAVFAFPLLVGAVGIGALEIYWKHAPQAYTAVADGLLFAGTALRALLSRPGLGLATAGDSIGRWPEVHQATGMVSVQASVRLDAAYALLRSYAYGNDLSLREVAVSVVERRLSFRPEAQT